MATVFSPEQGLRFAGSVDANTTDQALEEQYGQIQAACLKLQTEIQEIQNKLPKMVSPVYRQGAQNRLRTLQAQLKSREQGLRPLGLRLRQREIKAQIAHLTQLKTEWPSPDILDNALETSLSTITSALTGPPYGGTAWAPPLEQIRICLNNVSRTLQVEDFQADLPRHIQTLKQIPLPEKADEQEKNLLKRYVLLIENLILQALTKQSEKIDLPPEQSSTSQPSPSLVGGEGELQISFDFEKKTSVIKDQLGVQLKNTRPPYDQSLQEGIANLEKGFAKYPPLLHLLQAAILALTEAISTDKSRFEAYFSLGYLFANLADWHRALKLLETAYAISKRGDIQSFIDEVRTQASKR